MLQYNAIDKRALELLRKMMAEPRLNAYNLVGGTALALQMGHRLSVDLDMFTDANSFDKEELHQTLEQFGFFKIEKENNILYQVYLENIKIDFVKYSYPNIREITEIEGIRMLNIEDIAAMKLSAITNRGAKKDFYDLYFLLQKYTMNEIVSFYKEKYPNHELFYTLKSLTYFEDAEVQIEPKLIQIVEWETVKSKIEEVVYQYLKENTQ